MGKDSCRADRALDWKSAGERKRCHSMSFRGPRRLPHLPEDVCSMGSPRIDRVQETVEGKASVYRDENHRIEPSCCGPPEVGPLGERNAREFFGDSAGQRERLRVGTAVDPGGSRHPTIAVQPTGQSSVAYEHFEGAGEVLDDPRFAGGDMTMLDDNIVLYTSEFSEGANHCGSNMLFLLAGSAGGQWRTGRHLHFMDASSSYRTDHLSHNLFASILQACGSSANHFGNEDAVYKGSTHQSSFSCILDEPRPQDLGWTLTAHDSHARKSIDRGDLSYMYAQRLDSRGQVRRVVSSCGLSAR